jgi:hypothetical protein
MPQNPWNNQHNARANGIESSIINRRNVTFPVDTYADLNALPYLPEDGDRAEALDTGKCYLRINGAWAPLGGDGTTIDSTTIFIETSVSFPPIPTDRVRLVHITGVGDSTASHVQLWYAAPGYVRWEPLVKFTEVAGIPGTTP